jgi:3-oxoacyl-[acyl-carrier-protein] synthase-1
MTDIPSGMLTISGIGAITCAGLDAQQCCASIRADINRFVSHPEYLVETRPGANPDEPLPPTVAMVPILDPQLNSEERLIRLLTTAFQDLMNHRMLERSAIERTGFFLALPQEEPGVTSLRLDASLIDEFVRRTALPSFPVTRVSRAGNTGMAALIRESAEHLASGRMAHCIIAGVDSYFIGNRLALLDRQGRLKSPVNAGGLVPGEGAAVIMLEPRNSTDLPHAALSLKIEGLGIQMESNPILGEKTSTGEGLHQAILDAVGNRGEGFSCDWVIGDLNGEAYQAFEWGTVLVRLGSLFANLNGIWHPADCVGDIGAATTGLHLAQVMSAFQRDYPPCDDALIWASSDSGERAAMLLSRNLN